MKNNAKESSAQHYKLLAGLERFEGQAAPPVHLWNPEQISEIDIRIDQSGDWFHDGSLIKRTSLARLFASVLRLEADGEYYLVTPVEKCRIVVEDVPFQAILMTVEGTGKDQKLVFTTNMAEQASADEQHPMSFVSQINADGDASYIPYVEIRSGLKAKISRNVYYQLMDLLTTGDGEHAGWHGIWSGGVFFRVVNESALS
jgi:hypothetical protein